MKNTLAENMMRFGTKNLSEAAQKELVVNSIMETIEQHGLYLEVRKALLEQLNPNAIIQQIKTAMAGLGTDNMSVYNAVVRGIKNKQIYDQVLALVNKMKYKTILAWLSTDMEETKPNSFRSLFDPKNEKITGGIERHLKQFNSNEEWSDSGILGAGGI
jgi:hypothetical protein